MWVVFEFLLRILLACGVFATCLTVMWFIAWMLILRHVKLFQEIICGSGKTPHPSPLKSPEKSPVVYNPFSGKQQTQPEYLSHRAPSPLSLPPLTSPHHPLTSPPIPLPFSNSSPDRHRRSTLSPGIHPRVQRPINSKRPTTTPCQINHFVDHWF